ncbi:hypothetical protein BpHYR1_049044 [Brachionus plicatilis]|uniref:Uncharacterized protein n=1 Tax=Brachionus plicatilis TaxID=10195 RepID=A0A3M7S627_BRAPC|nr:hypothetical protein BpHYR1_049044 [Brachionus plicatilis]
MLFTQGAVFKKYQKNISKSKNLKKFSFKESNKIIKFSSQKLQFFGREHFCCVLLEMTLH